MTPEEYKRKFWPERVSAHILGRRWICDEDSRLSALGTFQWANTDKKDLPKPIQRGSILDGWLKERPKSYDEYKLRKALDRLIETLNQSGENRITTKMPNLELNPHLPIDSVTTYVWSDFLGYGAMRFYRGTGVISHFDDFRTYYNRQTGTKKAWHVEYKGLTHPKWIRFEAPAANSQVMITQWVWQPVWKYLGWDVDGLTVTEYYDLRNAMFLERQIKEWSEELSMAEMDSAFDLYSGNRRPIPPAPFKCVSCMRKDICTINKEA